jgi:hypothetical protein
MQAINELGQSFTLAELAELSISNPTIRRSELMTRIGGFEAYANAQDHVAMFYTITTPSRFHSHNQGGAINPNWDGSTPRQGAEYLQAVWARIRAAWGRAEIAPYGFRVAEPHHDGTPHWHLLLFMPKSQEKRSSRIVKDHAFGMFKPHFSWSKKLEKEYGDGRYVRSGGFCLIGSAGGEPGAAKYRYKAVEIDRSRGTAAGYIAKYIAKNIDGFALDADLYGKDPIEGARRVAAWASTWGIRQFQQIGGPPVGVWRELRRVDESPGLIEKIREVADAGDWQAYVSRMGGAGAARRAAPVSLYKLGAVDLDTGEIRINRYHEPAADQVRGVEDIAGNCQITRVHEWAIQQLSAGAAAAPWTRVNNCTPAPVLDQDTVRKPPPGWRPLRAFRLADGLTWGQFLQIDTAERAENAKRWEAERAANGGRCDGGGDPVDPGLLAGQYRAAAGIAGA